MKLMVHSRAMVIMVNTKYQRESREW